MWGHGRELGELEKRRLQMAPWVQASPGRAQKYGWLVWGLSQARVKMLLGTVVTLGLTGLQGHFQDGSPLGKFLPGCSSSCGLCIGLLECSLNMGTGSPQSK